jgi:DNA-binding CsgD family transcriptional regulator
MTILAIASMFDSDQPAEPQAEETSTPRMPEVVLAHFLRGDERAAEFAALLAIQEGYPIGAIYEVLRRAVSAPRFRDIDVQSLNGSVLDERLARLAARLQTPSDGHRDPQAMVLMADRRGVGVCITHMFSGRGVPALRLGFDDLSRHHRGAAGLHGQFPGVRYVVVDAAGADARELLRLAHILEQLHIAGPNFTTVILADDKAAVAEARLRHPDHVSFVSDLTDMLTAAGVGAESSLTPRERDVLECISDGATNQQTATALGISIATVKTYLERAQTKLCSCDRASTVAAALRHGWI